MTYEEFVNRAVRTARQGMGEHESRIILSVAVRESHAARHLFSAEIASDQRRRQELQHKFTWTLTDGRMDIAGENVLIECLPTATLYDVDDEQEKYPLVWKAHHQDLIRPHNAAFGMYAVRDGVLLTRKLGSANLLDMSGVTAYAPFVVIPGDLAFNCPPNLEDDLIDFLAMRLRTAAKDTQGLKAAP